MLTGSGPRALRGSGVPAYAMRVPSGGPRRLGDHVRHPPIARRRPRSPGTGATSPRGPWRRPASSRRATTRATHRHTRPASAASPRLPPRSPPRGPDSPPPRDRTRAASHPAPTRAHDRCRPLSPAPAQCRPASASRCPTRPRPSAHTPAAGHRVPTPDRGPPPSPRSRAASPRRPRSGTAPSALALPATASCFPSGDHRGVALQISQSHHGPALPRLRLPCRRLRPAVPSSAWPCRSSPFFRSLEFFAFRRRPSSCLAPHQLRIIPIVRQRHIRRHQVVHLREVPALQAEPGHLGEHLAVDGLLALAPGPACRSRPG